MIYLWNNHRRILLYPLLSQLLEAEHKGVADPNPDLGAHRRAAAFKKTAHATLEKALDEYAQRILYRLGRLAGG